MAADALVTQVTLRHQDINSHGIGYIGWTWFQVSASMITVSQHYKISDVSCTKSENFNGFRLVLELSLRNPLKPDV